MAPHAALCHPPPHQSEKRILQHPSNIPLYIFKSFSNCGTCCGFVGRGNRTVSPFWFCVSTVLSLQAETAAFVLSHFTHSCHNWGLVMAAHCVFVTIVCFFQVILLQLSSCFCSWFYLQRLILLFLCPDPSAMGFIISPWSLLLMPSGNISFTGEYVTQQDLRAFTAPEVLEGVSLSSVSDIEKVNIWNLWHKHCMQRVFLSW